MLALIGAAQQDPQYNMYQFNQMLINPAYAGAKDGLSAMAGTRQQWAGIEGSPQTIFLSVHAPIMKKNLGVGLTVMNDAIGPRNVIGFNGNVAYIAKLTKTLKLSLGINAGYNRYQFNFDKVTFYNADEMPAAFYQPQNKGVFDLGAGAFLKSHNFFVGIGVSHLTSPSIYDYTEKDPSGTSRNYAYRVRAHLAASAGYSFRINENAIFAPTIMLKQVRGTVSGDINLNFFLFRKLWLGAFYRTGFGMGGLLQYLVTDKIRVAYSYDSGMKDVRKLGSSHEIILGLDLAGKQKTKVASPRFL